MDKNEGKRERKRIGREEERGEKRREKRDFPGVSTVESRRSES